MISLLIHIMYYIMLFTLYQILFSLLMSYLVVIHVISLTIRMLYLNNLFIQNMCLLYTSMKINVGNHKGNCVWLMK